MIPIIRARACTKAFGVAIEVVADVQKALWVKGGRTGGFCAVGVWRLSRHPNYFGEICQWVCLWLLAYSSSSGVLDKAWWATSLRYSIVNRALLPYDRPLLTLRNTSSAPSSRSRSCSTPRKLAWRRLTVRASSAITRVRTPTHTSGTGRPRPSCCRSSDTRTCRCG